EFDLPAVKAVSTRFPSALVAAQRALQSEKDVAGQFDRMAALASAEGDHRGHQFLQWFIEEQVEEEAKLQSIVDLIDSGINLFQAEALLGNFESGPARRWPQAGRPSSTPSAGAPGRSSTATGSAPRRCRPGPSIRT